MLNSSKYTLLFGLLAVGISSCVSEGEKTGWEYGPNMYVSQGYEAYSQEKKFENNPNGMTMRLPVAGSIARGQLNYVYPYPNTNEGYTASEALVPTVAATRDNVKEGERLYNIYCWHCHGKQGNNDGPIFKTKKMNPPPWLSYTDQLIQELPVGKIYHTITYGKGFMGSHADKLNPEERWQVIHYVKYLSLGENFRFAENENDIEVIQAADSTSTPDEN